MLSEIHAKITKKTISLSLRCHYKLICPKAMLYGISYLPRTPPKHHINFPSEYNLEFFVYNL